LAHEHQTDVSLEMLQKSVDSLLRQMKLDGSFLNQRRPLGLGANGRRRAGFGLDEDY
jgi:hypothetical protein